MDSFPIVAVFNEVTSDMTYREIGRETGMSLGMVYLVRKGGDGCGWLTLSRLARYLRSRGVTSIEYGSGGLVVYQRKLPL